MSLLKNAGPPSGRLLDDGELQRQVYQSGYGALRLASGFGGVGNPTVLWQDMVSDRQVAFQYYRELEEKDDGVANVLDKLKRSVLRRPYKISAGDDSAAALEISNFISAQFDRANIYDAFGSVLDAAGYGVSIHEITFNIAPGEVALASVDECPQELFTFGPMSMPQTGPLRYLREPGDAMTGGDLVPREKFIVFTYRRRARSRRGRPLLRSVFWPSWFKRNALRFWLRFAEKGPGTAAVKYAQGAGEDEQKKALAAAEAIVESVAIAIPQNFELVVELLTSARAQDPAVFEKLYDRMDHSIARRVLGQTLTSFGGSEQGKGTQALGEIHKEVENETSVELTRALEVVINRQLIRPLVIWNFGPNAPMPTLEFQKEEPADLIVRSQIDERLQQMGVPIPLNYARMKYGIPEASGKDDTILIPAKAAAMGAGGPGASSGGISTGDTAFSEERIKKDQEDFRRLALQLKRECYEAYAQRVRSIADVIAGGRGV